MRNATQIHGKTGKEVAEVTLSAAQLAAARKPRSGEVPPEYQGYRQRLVIVEGYLYRLTQEARNE